MSFNVLELYPTPVYVTEFSEEETNSVQTEMLSVLQDLKHREKFSYKNNWNTHKLSDTTFTGNLLEVYDCQNFLRTLDAHVGSYLMYSCKVQEVGYEITQSWLTLSGRGDYAHIHNHGVSHISGCYYIQTNGEDGDFIIPCTQSPLETNRVFANMTRSTNIQPKVGKLILFPGWVNHGVGRNQTDHDRVSLSFNILLKDGEKPNYNIY